MKTGVFENTSHIYLNLGFVSKIDERRKRVKEYRYFLKVTQTWTQHENTVSAQKLICESTRFFLERHIWSGETMETSFHTELKESTFFINSDIEWK